MTVNIGQTTYNLFPTQAAAGMLADNTVNRIQSYQCANNQTIRPGTLLQLASDFNSVQECQTLTSNTGTLVGFAVLLTAREGLGSQEVTTNAGATYQAGDMVAVLTRGSIFAAWNGTTINAAVTPNVYHSSNTALTTFRGFLTDSATNTVAGYEVTAAPATFQIRPGGTIQPAGSGSYVLVDVNMDGQTS
jgi:hypothetical protein